MAKPMLWAAVLAALGPWSASAQNVLTYHATPNRHGAYIVPGLTDAAAADMHLDTGFNGAVNGAIYVQPLSWRAPGAASAQIIVATETNAVYALNSHTGAVTWQTQLAPSVPVSALRCGNINPEGITGTPVIDAAAQTLYLDATTTQSAGPRHMMYALSLADGHVLPGWPVDIQAALAARGVTFDSTVQGQRSALQDFNGDIYLSYGGRSGDCGNYHGVVVQVHPANQSVVGVSSTTARGGGIWSQGGLALNGKSLLATTGNTFSATTWSGGEAIMRLRPGLAAPASTDDYYAPANWQALDSSDADLGGTEALGLLVNNGPHSKIGRTIAFGKDGNAYLVSSGNLGGVGGAAVIAKVSSSRIITAPAIYNTDTLAMVAITAPAESGCSGQSVIMLKVSGQGTNPITQAWCTVLNGRGSPIVTTTDGSANPIVWVTGAEGDNELHGYNAMTGQQIFGGGTMTGLRHFQTILVAGGRFYVAADNKIYAFAF